MVERTFASQHDTDAEPPGPGTVLDDVRHAVAVLAKTDWDALPGEVIGGLIEPVGMVRNTVDSVQASMADAFDRSSAWRTAGSRTCAHRVAYQLRLPTPEAKRQINRGAALRSMPVTAQAFTDGRLTARHVDRLVRANRAEVADAFAESEAELVEQACRRPFREWDGLVTRWERLVDPDQAEADADRQAADRAFAAVTDPTTGVGRLEGRLAPLPMAEFSAELERIEERFFDQDWKDARARLGDKATAGDLARTPAQRSADALVEMARRSAACTLEGDAPAARFVVNLHTDQVTLLEAIARLCGVDPADLPDDLSDGPVTDAGRRFCETASGAPVAPTDMLLAALCGRVRRVLYDPDGRLVDLGRTQRLFTGSLRDAVIARARTCIHPDCDLPADRCEIDHRRSWTDQGRTNTDNGDPACDHANRWKARNPQLWRQAIRADQRRRRGSGTPDNRRMQPPPAPATRTRPPDPPLRT